MRSSFEGGVGVIDGSMQLADGRSLAFTDAGAPGGFPIFYFHGAGPRVAADLRDAHR